MARISQAQRFALPARTMDLAQDNVQRLSILGLPEDILREIFDHLSNEFVYNDKGEIVYYYRLSKEDEDFKTLQNARLVCRRFCEVTSPLLVPALCAYISSESLSRIDKLTRNPQIAAGVRLVQVVLEYRPRELAQNLSLYKNLRYQQVEEVRNRCEYHTDFITDIEELPNDTRKMLDAIAIYKEIMAAWDDACSDPEDTEGFGHESDEGRKFKQLLYQCHEEYRRKHDDQYRLLTDGSFVRTLAAAVSRMTSLRSLAFFDHLDRPLDDFFDRSGVTILANDTESLRRLLVMPQDWAAIEEMDPTPELLPAKLLWELPIAIYERGQQLREVAVSALPLKSNFDMLCPHSRDEIQPAWDRLQAAFRCIQRVNVGSRGNMNCQDIRLQHLPAEKQAYIDKYLTALLSGPCLEVIDIDLYALSLNDGRFPSEINAKDGLYRIGSVLASVCCPHLRRLDLSHVSFRQEEFEKFLRGLGDRLEYIALYEVGVLDGGWERPLNVLRERLLSGRSCGECSVKFDSLRGGGFDSVLSDDDSDISDVESSPGGLLVLNAEKYVSGVEGMVNQLAHLEA